LGSNNLGNLDNKFRDQKKKTFAKNQYHGSFRGDAKFEGRIEVLKAAVSMILLAFANLYSMF